MHKIIRLLPIALAAGLAGCFTQNEDRYAGVDDFPNSIYGRVSGFLGESQAGIVPAVPSEALGFIEAGGASGNPRMTAAYPAWAGSAPPETVITVDTTTQDQGYITYLAMITDSLRTTYDMARIRWDSSAQDTIKNNENVMRFTHTVVWTDGKIERVEATDVDGDSILSAVAGRTCKAKLQITQSDSGMTSLAELVLGPKPDSVLAAKPDTLIYSARWWKTRGKDTLQTAEYSDADADGIVIDNSKASVVVLNYRELNPPAKPGTAETRMTLKTRLHYQAAGELLGISGEERLRNGRVNRFGLLNLQGGSDIRLQDTLLARFTTVGAAGDTLDSLTGDLRTTMGESLDSKSDDRIYGLSLKVVNRLGDERRGSVDFISDAPMLPDSKPSSGRIALKLEYADSTSLLLEGTLKAGAMSADVTDRSGKRFHAEWDAAGNLISVKRL